jgi:O-antigen ligase
VIAPVNKSNGVFALLATIFLLAILAAGLTGYSYLVVIPFLFLLVIAGWQQLNAIFFLLIISIPFSFEYNFSPSLGTDIPDEGLMLLASFLFMAYWLYKPSVVDGTTWRHPLIVLLFINTLWLTVTMLLSTETIVSLKIVVAKLWYLAAFVLAPLIVFREKKWIRIIAVGLAVSMLAVVVITMWRHASSGFSFASINKSLEPFFRNHVNYSSMLVCVIPVFVAWYQLTARKDARILLAIAILILLAALFFSYARGAWLALALGIAAAWLVKRKLLFAAYLITITMAIGAVFWLKSGDRYLRFAHDYQTTIFHPEFKEHLVATYQLKDVSTAERFYRWIAGVRMVKDKWLNGFGPGTFYSNYKPYGVPAFKTWVSSNKEQSTVHNYFLLITIEQGLPGLIFFLLLLGAMFYYAQYLYHRVKDVFYKMIAFTISIMLVMVTTVNFLSDLIETDKVGSLFYLCLAALLATHHAIKKELKPSPHIERVS